MILEYDVAVLTFAIGLITFVYYIINSYMSFRFKGPAKTNKKVNPTEVTILVPVYKEDKDTFENCTNAIKGQGARFIVVGDGVEEPYRSITTKNGGRFIFLKENAGQRKAHAAGIKYINTKYTMFVDSDTIIPPNTLVSMLSKFEGNTGGMGTMISIKLENNWVSHSAEFFQRAKEIVFKAMSSNGSIFVIGGRCCMYQTAAIKDFIQSDEFLNSSVLGRKCIIAEDMHITSHILKSGYKATIDYDVNVATDAPKSFRELFKQMIRWARGGYFQFFKDLADGSYLKKGALYSFEMFYIYLIPMTLLFIGLLRLNLMLNDVLLALTGGVSNIWDVVFLNANLGSISTIPYITMAIGTAGTVIFLFAIVMTVSHKRLKILIAGFAMSALMFCASIYALFTVWEQGEWLTR